VEHSAPLVGEPAQHECVAGCATHDFRTERDFEHCLLDRLNLTLVRARGKSDSKTDGQTDRQQTDRHTDGLSKTTFLDVLRVSSQIRSYLEVDFLHDANSCIDMEVKLYLSRPRAY